MIAQNYWWILPVLTHYGSSCGRELFKFSNN